MRRREGWPSPVEGSGLENRQGRKPSGVRISPPPPIFTGALGDRVPVRVPISRARRGGEGVDNSEERRRRVRPPRLRRRDTALRQKWLGLLVGHHQRG